MKIKAIRFQNFKRFSDLAVEAIPETAKLVLVVGPNGCGKSSLFDALLQWYRSRVGFGRNADMLYYRKNHYQPFGWEESVEVELHGTEQPKKGGLYVRTAYRHDPDFSVGDIGRLNNPADQLRIGRAIDPDQTVSENYKRLVYDTTAAVFDSANDQKSVQTLREELIGEVRASMRRVFGDLQLNNISDPLNAGAFMFEKGTSSAYHYKNLSGGEKAAFDLILDLHIKRKFYPEAVYCIDEIETHLHTKVQGALLRELCRIVPEASQLWVTTHSLGVLRAAQELAESDPGAVAIIDFDGADADEPTRLLPVTLGRLSWEKLLSITLDDLALRVAPRVLVVCEGSSVGNRRKDFDAEIYNRVLGAQAPDMVFVSGGSAGQVGGMALSIRDILPKLLPATRVVALADRDDLSDAEVAEFEASGGIVLSRRNLESYLYAEDVIDALAASVGRAAEAPAMRGIVQAALTSSIARGNRPDDMKSAAGTAFVGLRNHLDLTRTGNTSEAFMRDTLAPLIRPGMATFERLKQDILDRVR